MNSDKTEREFKWEVPLDTLSLLARALHGDPALQKHETLIMSASYFDTPDNLVYQNRAAVRIRRENNRSVCCMKRTLKKDGASAVREEFEVEADDLHEGLRKLPEAGAPQALCELLAEQEFIVLAETSFIRNAYTFAFTEPVPFTAELAVDVGELGGNGSFTPFEELELELKSGDADAFYTYAKELERKFRLVPQPRSKLARAVASAKKGKAGTIL